MHQFINRQYYVKVFICYFLCSRPIFAYSEVICVFCKCVFLTLLYLLLQVKQVRDPEEQVTLVGVPEEHLGGHAFHMYHLTSPDGT